jgi:hypothetical protein
MPPASNFGSGRFGRGGPAARSIVTAVAAALVGTIIGGLSVLGVVLAVVEPPNHDIRPEARDSSANPPAAASTLAATQVQANSPAPAVQPQTAAPLPEQAVAPAPGSAPAPQTAWPDALTRRTLQDQANGADKPNQPSTAQNGDTPAAVNDQASFDKKDVRDNARKQQSPLDRSAASPSGVPARLSNTDQAQQRAVSAPPPTPPAPAVQPAMSDTANESSPGAVRSLFDFFGNDHYRDERGTQTAPQGDVSPSPPPASQTQYGAKARAMRQQRPNGTDQSSEAPPVNQQQRVIILQDQDDADAPRHNDNWGGFFGRNDWNDNGHRW